VHSVLRIVPLTRSKGRHFDKALGPLLRRTLSPDALSRHQQPDSAKRMIRVSMAQDKPTSEQLRLEDERLRATAAELMKHAATLIEKSAKLEKQISRLKRDKKSG
jgi:hypothetical protein